MTSKRGHITHVIFDVDGLLLDTEKIYFEVYSSIVAKYGKSYDWSIKPKIMGMKEESAAQMIIDLLDLPLQPSQLLREAANELDKIFPFCNLKPGAESLVRHLHREGIPIAVSTGSSAYHFNLKTQTKHKEMFKLFHHIVCCSSDSDIKHGKPAPDAYTVAANRFDGGSPNPQNVLVFEDAPNGVLSGLAANMKTVFIPDPRLDKSFYPSGSYQLLTSLEQFVPEEWGLPAYKQ
ncbi:uncharacterized protein LOC100376804 [Saccoglossus kowalevskii]|uniref:(DL)-glycerol-3-phosphatase 1-like n=1 Tax=Saccoglossus kowalevskii TaxID=10224 RepID=A0ABM0GJU3_SACKO|nr:PREDICTED: (DL)-glycerol-3-phosphatase 1-like [Saccoglossus kowalevskii]